MINRSYNKLKQSAPKSSSDDADSNDETSSGTAESGTSSDTESEMDTTETSFSSKSATECGASSGQPCKQLQGQQGLLRMNNRNYAVYCGESGPKSAKHLCNHHHHHHHHHHHRDGDDESKKEVK